MTGLVVAFEDTPVVRCGVGCFRTTTAGVSSSSSSSFSSSSSSSSSSARSKSRSSSDKSARSSSDDDDATLNTSRASLARVDDIASRRQRVYWSWCVGASCAPLASDSLLRLCAPPCVWEQPTRDRRNPLFVSTRFRFSGFRFSLFIGLRFSVPAGHVARGVRSPPHRGVDRLCNSWCRERRWHAPRAHPYPVSVQACALQQRTTRW